MSLDGGSPLVVDASALFEYVIGTGLGRQVASIIEEPESRRYIPDICDLEMIAAIRSGVLRGFVREARAQEAFADYLSLRLTRRQHRPLLSRIFELRANLVPYDAAYVALAERLDATFVTCDLRLTRAARQFTDLNVVGVG